MRPQYLFRLSITQLARLCGIALSQVDRSLWSLGRSLRRPSRGDRRLALQAAFWRLHAAAREWALRLCIIGSVTAVGLPSADSRDDSSHKLSLL